MMQSESESIDEPITWQPLAVAIGAYVLFNSMAIRLFVGGMLILYGIVGKIRNRDTR